MSTAGYIFQIMEMLLCPWTSLRSASKMGCEIRIRDPISQRIVLKLRCSLELAYRGVLEQCSIYSALVRVSPEAGIDVAYYILSTSPGSLEPYPTALGFWDR